MEHYRNTKLLKILVDVTLSCASNRRDMTPLWEHHVHFLRAHMFLSICLKHLVSLLQVPQGWDLNLSHNHVDLSDS